jgi:hypothetical protein
LLDDLENDDSEDNDTEPRSKLDPLDMDAEQDQEDLDINKPENQKCMPEYKKDGIPIVEFTLPTIGKKRVIPPDTMWGDSPWSGKRAKLEIKFRRYIKQRFSKTDREEIYNKKIKDKYSLNGLSEDEMTIRGLIKGMWRLMRALRAELKKAGRKWLKLYFFGKAGSVCNIHYREEAGDGTWLKARFARDVYKSWRGDWSDGNIRRMHHFWDHLVQSRLGWEGDVLAWLLDEVGLVFDQEALHRFQDSNVISIDENGKKKKRSGPMEKNTILDPFKKQVKDQRDYMRLKNQDFRNMKRKNGKKGSTRKCGRDLEQSMLDIIEENPILVKMRTTDIFIPGGSQER